MIAKGTVKPFLFFMGKNMKRIKNFLAWVLLTTILVVNLAGAYYVPVEASGTATDLLSNLVDGILRNFGISIDSSTLIDFCEKIGLSPESDKISEIDTKLHFTNINGDLLTLGDNTLIDALSDGVNVVCSPDTVGYIVGEFDTYVQEHPEITDVVWIPVISSDDLIESKFASITQYQQFRSFTDGRNYSFLVIDSNGACLKGLDDAVFFNNASYLSWNSVIPAVALLTNSWGGSNLTGAPNIGSYFLHTDGLGYSRAQSYFDIIYSADGTASLNPQRSMFENGSNSCVFQYPFDYKSAPFSGWGILVRGCNTKAMPYVPFFRNADAYKEWITGSGSYYRFESGYQGGDITINPNADYSAITDAIKNAMQQSNANGDNMATMLSHMQSAFSGKLDEINNALGDISDNTGETNSWLEKIYDLLVKIDKKINGILAVDAVDTAVNVLSELWGNIWNWINNKLEMVEIVQQVSELGNVMKKKFPFSIPWDVYSILLMFDAPAKPPVIRLHFEFPMLDNYVYDYEYVMDDDAWANFATVCRFFLTIGYQISLMHLTQKLYASGLFDMPAPGKRRK